MCRVGPLRLLAALVVAAGVLVFEAPAAPAGQTAPRTDIALLVASDEVVSADGRLHELMLDSVAMGRPIGVRVLLPAGYDDPASAGDRYPVLLLLHGTGDDHRSWSNRTEVEELTAGLPLIVVMPDAGRNTDAGWYSDWVNGPRWESFHIGELLPFVDARYRTTGTRQGRVVAGLSMGGFGALSYAARHPELFIGAGAFSGAVDMTLAGDTSATTFALLHDQVGTPNDDVWGPYSTDEVRWRTHNPVDLAPNLRWTNLWTSVGNAVPGALDEVTGVPLEAGVGMMNRNLDGRLTSLGIEHAHRIHQGTHHWPYWEADLRDWLGVAASVLADPPADPGTWSYRSAEADFSAWGWDVTVIRDRLEFLELTDVSETGLTITGSGTIDVTTAPLFDPGRRYRVEMNGTQVEESTADRDGRLTLQVTFGAAVASATLRVEPLPFPTPEVAGAGVAVGAGAASTATPVGPASGVLPATGGGSAWPAFVVVAGMVALAATARTAKRRW